MKKNNSAPQDESTNHESPKNESTISESIGHQAADSQPEGDSPEPRESTETAANASEPEAIEQSAAPNSQAEDGGPAMPPDEQLFFSDSVSLSPDQAAALSKWIITQSHGIYSADGSDDHPKAAFVVLLKALAFEEDRIKREEIFNEVEKTVFRYTLASDNAIERFTQRGLDNLEALLARAYWGKE